MRRTIRTNRFFLLLLIGVSLLLIARGWYFYLLTRQDVGEVIRKDVRTLLGEAVERVGESSPSDRTRLEEILRTVASESPAVRYLAVVRGGRIVAASDKSLRGRPFHREEGVSEKGRGEELLERPLLYREGGGEGDTFLVVAGISSPYVHRLLYEKMRRFVLLSVMVPLFSITLIWWLFGRLIVRPLEELERMVQSRATTFPHRYLLKELNDLGMALSSTFYQIKEQIRALDYMAMYDKLTHLPNRHFMQNRIDQMIEQARHADGSFALMFLDLDNFKQINDTEGHDVGDAILTDVSRRLRKLCGEGTDVVGRVGGDEFMWLSTHSDDASLEALVRRIIPEINRPFHHEGREFRVGISIGIARYPADGTNRITLSKNADIALYEAKALGRNRHVFFNEELARALVEDSNLEREMERAIERGEFEVYYQPKIAIATGEVSGAEALVRWIHPQHGRIPPDQFIPVAERSGLIRKLGHYVIEHTCHTLVRLRERGIEIPIAVNLSALQVRPGLLEEIDAVVESYGLPRRLLGLEITETVLMESFEESVAALNALAEAGYRISLDDFGTGYSSLAYLRMLPVKILKIDKSFITQIDTYQHSRALVEGIVALGHALELTVVAEGVENEKVLAFLRETGCDAYQGYLFSPPLPFDTFCRRCWGERCRQNSPEKERA